MDPKTLLLSKTSFPLKNTKYQKLKSKRIMGRKKKSQSIRIKPKYFPPYANGKLHIRNFFNFFF